MANKTTKISQALLRYSLAWQLLIVMGVANAADSSAQSIVDVYGTNAKLAQKIISRYSTAVGKIEMQLQQELTQSSNNHNTVKLQSILSQRNILIEQIKRYGNFIFVNFNTIFYPKNRNQYTTIEVVHAEQKYRLGFINKPTRLSILAPKHDLINTMLEFEQLEGQLLIQHALDVSKVICPVYHCILGFTHPKLKPYLNTFNHGAQEDKQLIIDTLNFDPSPKRRAAAAFLMGHMTNPQEIVALLLPHVTDPDVGVRNNVMRVLAATMQKAHIYQIDLAPFLNLLDSPENTDRNKALFILLAAAQTKAAKKIIIDQAGHKLLALLQLKQPNNHNTAFALLQKISGQNFGEDNFLAWRNYLAIQGNKDER